MIIKQPPIIYIDELEKYLDNKLIETKNEMEKQKDMDIANMTVEEIAEHLTKDELAMANEQIKVMMGLRKSKHPKSANKAKQLKKRKQNKLNRKAGRNK